MLSFNICQVGAYKREQNIRINSTLYSFIMLSFINYLGEK